MKAFINDRTELTNICHTQDPVALKSVQGNLLVLGTYRQMFLSGLKRKLCSCGNYVLEDYEKNWL